MKPKNIIITSLIFTIVLVLLLWLNVIMLPNQAVSDIYNNPSPDNLNEAYDVVDSIDFEYEIISRTYNPLEQTYEVVYDNSQSNQWIKDTILIKNKIISWEVDNINRKYYNYNDEDKDQVRENIEDSSPDDEVNNEGETSLESPNGRVATIVAEGEGTSLILDGEEIDQEVTLVRWYGEVLIYVTSEDETSHIKKRSNQTEEILKELASHSVGFEIVENTLFYTSETEVGVINLNTKKSNTIKTFEEITLNTDHAYIPNIIPDEETSTVTFEIYDSHHLQNKQIQYVIVSTTGEIVDEQVVILE